MLLRAIQRTFAINFHPSSTAYPGWGRRDSSLGREAQTFLSPATSPSSSGEIPRRSQASREIKSLQHVLGLPGGLLCNTTARGRVRITADVAPFELSSFCSIFPSLVNKTLMYLNSSTWGMDLLPKLEKAQPIPAENHGFSCFTFSCKPIHRELDVTDHHGCA